MIPESYLQNFDDCWAHESYNWARSLEALDLEDEDDRRTRDLLVEYIIARETARKHRLNGHIQEALRLESICEGVYQTLPSYARW